MNDVITPEKVWSVLATILDPEFGLSIVDLGLIYEVATTGRDVAVAMTLTSPGCPAGEMILDGAHTALAGLAGVGEVRVDLVWEPRWTPERLTPEGRAHLGWPAPDPA